MISRGIGTLARGMQALIDFQDVTAHNLANVTTNGFKRTHITFQNIMDSQVQAKNNQGEYENIGALSIGSRTDRTYIDFSSGGLMESDRKLDVAFQGDGFFKIRHRDIKDNAPYNETNYYYQRTGNFAIDDENYLINKDGDYIMDMQNKRIRITRDPATDDITEMNRFELTKNLVFGEDGQVGLVSENYNIPLQKIQVCDFKDKTKVSSIGDGKYLPIYNQDAGIYTKADGTFSLQQGMNEMSNASTIVEMLNTINVSRGYEAMSNILKSQSDAMQGVISLGNISG